MKSKLIALLLSTLFCASVFAGVAELDWATITTQDSVNASTGYDFSVTLKKQFPTGTKIKCDIHMYDANGKRLGMGGHIEAKPAATPGKPIKFARSKIKEHPELDHYVVVAFASPDGDYKNAIAKGNSKPISFGGKVGASKASSASSSAPAVTTSAGTVVKDAGWCVIETPASIGTTGTYDIAVTLKEPVPEGQTVNCHVRMLGEKNAYLGMGGWKPGQAPAAVGKPIIFRKYKPKQHDELKHFQALVFVAPNGDYSKASKQAFSEFYTIKFTDEEIKAKEEARIEKENRNRCPQGIFKNKSMFAFRPCLKKEVRSGESFDIVIDYVLDPTETWGDGTYIEIEPLGPWIDNPDGVYNPKRRHLPTSGLKTQRSDPLTVGKGTVRFTFTPKNIPRNTGVGFRARFFGADGKPFPWEHRTGAPALIYSPIHFDVVPATFGGLFTYDEVPTLRITWGSQAGDVGKTVEAAITLTAADGVTTKKLTKKLSVGFEGETTDVSLGKLPVNGLYAVSVTIGEFTQETFIGTIPDVKAYLNGRKTPFGCTNVGSDGAAATAAKLGMSHCRLFQKWPGLESMPGRWNVAGLDKTIDRLNAVGVTPWICLYGAPEWAIDSDTFHNPGYSPFPFYDDKWVSAVTFLANRYKGKLWGFEWLNEIVPGSCPDPVQNYLRLCKLGTATAKAIDPNFQFQMAGGLWPRNYRVDLFNAGIAEHIDVAPEHYADYNELKNSSADSRAGGIKRIWDNETARGYSIFGMPAVHALTNSLLQSRWVMRSWPGELIIGAEGITYFGGQADVCGNWSYLISDYEARPVAATLAVMSTKLGLARPVGGAYLDPGAIIYVFEREDGKGIATLMSYTKNPVEVSLPVKTKQIIVTDNQGNAKTVDAPNGVATLVAEDMPVFVEGFDLNSIAPLTTITVGNYDPMSLAPVFRHVAGNALKLSGKIDNPMLTPISGSFDLLVNGKVVDAKKFSLQPGDSTRVAFDLKQEPKDGTPMALRVTWADGSTASRDFKFNLIDPALLGNLLSNGGFEEAAEGKTGLKDWSGNGRKFDLGNEAAPGKHGTALKMEDTPNGYKHTSQHITLPSTPATYLYTAWVKTKDMSAGSNVNAYKPGGNPKAGQRYIMLHIWTADTNTKGWSFLTQRVDIQPGNAGADFTPVCKGAGSVLYDNVRVTLFDGTDFVAEAFYEEKSNKKIDGDISDWNIDACPIPLLSASQLSSTPANAMQSWKPEDLQGEAFFSWDNQALYFAALVQDDKHHAIRGKDAIKADSIQLAINPAGRDSTDAEYAMEWYISSAAPGTGSGKHTLYRPAEHSAGKKAEQLAQDSSAYSIAIKTVGDITVYEVRIPWSELGTKPELGLQMGLSLKLNDSDGDGSITSMSWGNGINPVWSPASFGSLTLCK
ncbi:MAG: hypothetical protein J6V41_01690 [Kiritimatiellae bacterium]|nr:hypothetical protein [Kiritimatiellia bacterium]